MENNMELEDNEIVAVTYFDVELDKEVEHVFKTDYGFYFYGYISRRPHLFKNPTIYLGKKL